MTPRGAPPTLWLGEAQARAPWALQEGRHPLEEVLLGRWQRCHRVQWRLLQVYEPLLRVWEDTQEIKVRAGGGLCVPGGDPGSGGRRSGDAQGSAPRPASGKVLLSHPAAELSESPETKRKPSERAPAGGRCARRATFLRGSGKSGRGTRSQGRALRLGRDHVGRRPTSAQPVSLPF